MNQPEFKIGEWITYRPFNTDNKVKVLGWSYPAYANGKPVYHCSARGNEETHHISGLVIKESEYYIEWDGTL